MKKRAIRLFCVLFLFFVSGLYADCCSYTESPCKDSSCLEKPHSYLRLRSQGSNTARELIGWQELINTVPEDCQRDCYGVFSVAYEYQRSFDSCKIANYLLGASELHFAGSQVGNRNNTCDIVADNFGLPTDFKGLLRIDPVIDNFIFDTQLYIGLDFMLPGLFFKMNAPVVHSRWDLGLQDCSQNVSNSPTAFPIGYMGIDVNAPTYNDMNYAYLSCENIQAIPALTTLREGLSGQTFGEMSTPWSFGRFPFCRQEITRLADIDFELGYTLFGNNCARLALYGLLTAPTGNKACPGTFFSPVVGNGQHWELGAGVLGFVNLIDRDTFNASIYFEGNVSHMFKNYQTRSFDFCKNGALSRYLLLKQIGKMVLLNNNTADLVIEDSAPAFEYEQQLYAGNLINAIDFTTRKTAVTVPVRGDFSVKLALGFCNSTVDFGYNIYGNSKEELCIQCQVPCGIDNRKYAIKGTTGTHSLATCVDAEFCGSEQKVIPVTLNASQSDATLFNGIVDPKNVDNKFELVYTNTEDTIIGTYRDYNQVTGIATNNIARLKGCDIDHKPTNNVGEVALAWNNTLNNYPDSTVPDISVLQEDNQIAYLSENPVLITTGDLDVDSATAPAQITHKFFTNLFYTWSESRFTPFVGFGGEIEWAIDTCNRFGVNQWGLLVKGGISF